MKKYLDLDNEGKRRLNSEIDGAAAMIGGSDWEPPRHKTSWDVLGLCKDCSHLEAAKTEYGSTFARCESFECRLRPGDPVVDCTSYKKTSILSLDDMKEMCIIIDPDKKKAGFIM